MIVYRYMAIGMYVGIATVGGAAYWFLYDPTGPQINYYQLSHFLQCPAEPQNFKGISCDLFQASLIFSKLYVFKRLNVMGSFFAVA